MSPGGASWTLRRAEPADAAALLAFLDELVREPDLDIPLEPGEISSTEGEERGLLSEYMASQNSLYLIALRNNRIIGELNLRGEARAAWRHIAIVGMSVSKGWRNRGLGSALLEEGIGWARANPSLRRLELTVYARNKSAIHLYRKFGFVREGIRRERIFENGKFLDDWIMALKVE